MTDRIADSTAEPLTPEQQELVDEIVAARGRLPTPFKAWIHCPALARLLMPLGNYFSRSTSLTKREIEIAVLILARRWRAEYVFAVHAREARDAGFDESQIEDLRSGRTVNWSDERERCIFEAVTSLVDAGSVSDAVFDNAKSVLGRPAIAELLALCGYYSSVALAMKFHNVAPPAG